jgi:glycosyltransferase involved in cell wall biosynthesis
MADRSSMKEAYAAQLRKLLSLQPRRVQDGLYATSVLTLLNRTYPFPVEIINRRLLRWQFGLLRKFRRQLKGDCTYTLVYPPGMYILEALRVLESDVVVADVVDDVLARVNDPRLASMYRDGHRIVFDAADHAFTTSEQVVDRFGDAPCDIHVLPNGVTVPEDYEEDVSERRFSGSGEEERPLAVYAGQLNQALDAEMITSVAERCPEVRFRFYGPVSDPAGRRLATALTERPNVDVAGSVPHTELQRYLSQADVLLNFKKPDHTTSGNDLLKIYEYLATGRPIVSPCVSPVDRFEDVIRVAETPDQFADQLRAALRDESEERSKRRVAYARSNSWASRVDDILSTFHSLYPGTGSKTSPGAGHSTTVEKTGGKWQ